MANLESQPKWSSVRLLEAHELARGGLNGNMNEQAKALAERTEFLNQEKASKSEIVQGVFEFGTYAEFDAAKATLPVNCTVVIGEENTTGSGQWGSGNNKWNGLELTKSTYDPYTKSKEYTNEKTLEGYISSAKLSLDLAQGGTHYYAKEKELLFSGYISSSGVFVSSTAGYKTSDFILIDNTKPLVYSLNASTSVSGISFWDENKTFISSINTNNDVTQKTVNAPLNAKFIRVTHQLAVSPSCYVYSDFDGINHQFRKALEYSDILFSGGDLINIILSDFIYSGYISSSGVFVSSTAGYKTTEFIELNKLNKLQYSLNASNTVAAISFWDLNKQFIGFITTNNVTDVKESLPLPNTKYIRVTSNTNVSPNSFLKMNIPGIIEEPSLLKVDNLKIEPSNNLASKEFIIFDKYVNNAGTISNGTGWKYIKIPVTPGQTYTFGRFTIDSAGYYTFHTAENTNIEGSSASFQNNSIPRTVTAPASAAYLLIDIARPTNTPEQHAQLTVNEGSTLIDYVDPVGVVTGIAGYKLSGVSSGEGIPPAPTGEYIEQNGNAILADVIVDSITTGALIANLPTSSAGLEVGQAYIDSGFIKVVM